MNTRSPPQSARMLASTPFTSSGVSSPFAATSACCEAGHSLNFACRYPFDEGSGQHFKRVFNEHRIASRARTAQQQSEGAQ